MTKYIQYIIIFLLLSVSGNGLCSNLEDRLSYAQSLNRNNDSEMLRISDSIADIYLKSPAETYKLDNLYRAAYLKARVLNRQGKLDEALQFLDTIQNFKSNPKHSLYLGYSYLIKGIVYKKKAQPQLTFENYEHAIHIFEEINDCHALVKARNNLANYYNSLSIYNAAIEQYKQCAELLKKCPNPHQNAIINRNLAGLYFNFEKNPTKAILLFKEALSGFQKLTPSPKTDLLILGTLNQITLLYLDLNNLKEAQYYAGKAAEKINENTPDRFIYNHKINLANLLMRDKRFSEAEKAYQTLEQYIDTTPQLKNYEARFYVEFAEFKIKLKTPKAYSKAEYLLSKAHKLAKEQDKIELLSQIALIRSEIYTLLLNHKEALKQLNIHLKLKETIFNKENIETLQRNKYQLDFIKKENQLEVQRLEQQEAIQQSIIQKNKLEKEKLQITIIALVMFAFLIGGLFWWYYHRKKESINKLVLESKNKALELELTNREREEEYKLFQNSVISKKEEQNRISRNLHDNIGANLAAIKLALDDDKDEAFGNLIDDVYQEVRNLSYELYDLSENKDLFSQILANYLTSIETASGIDIHYEVYPDVDFERLHSVKKRELFSIVREIVHNSIRHSGSKNMELIFSKEKDKLYIYFEDFGKGFDATKIKYGLGLLNIQKRIDILDGTFELDARENRGVIINISIPI